MCTAAVCSVHCEMQTATVYNITLVPARGREYRPAGAKCTERNDNIDLSSPRTGTRNNMIIVRLSKCVPIMRCVRVQIPCPSAFIMHARRRPECPDRMSLYQTRRGGDAAPNAIGPTSSRCALPTCACAECVHQRVLTVRLAVHHIQHATVTL